MICSKGNIQKVTKYFKNMSGEEANDIANECDKEVTKNLSNLYR